MSEEKGPTLGERKLTVAEVAAAYGTSEGTIRGFINRGELLALRLGPRLLRIHESDFRDFLSSRGAR